MNNNPKGHNQYTNNDSKPGSGTKQSTQPRNEEGQFEKKDSNGKSSSSGHKGQVNNPEGHNQYSK